MHGPKAFGRAGNTAVRILLLTHLPRLRAYLKVKAMIRNG